ncbi:MAG: DUF3189 family protein [Syntrophomonadaceae bacterium]|jgi:hypothetical protein
MKILFIGTTGVHHTLVAAHLFLGRLHKSDFHLVEGYADDHLDESGFPILVDDDGKGNQVYALGVGREVQVAERAIGQLVELLGYTSRDLIVHPVTIKGETLLLLLKLIPEALGGKIFSSFISKLLIKNQFSNIANNVANLKKQLP